MNRYSKWLEEGYRQIKQLDNCCESRLEYLSEYIFRFTTYDGGMGELFATHALEVCRAINEAKTFEYIKDEENYKWYLLMMNTNFFSGKLEWGSSIRGAWWNDRISFDSCGLWNDEGLLGTDFNFSGDEWKEFISAILEFAEGEE